MYYLVQLRSALVYVGSVCNLDGAGAGLDNRLVSGRPAYLAHCCNRRKYIILRAEDPPDTLVRGFLAVGGAEGAKTPTARKPLGPGYPPEGFRRFQVVECPFFT